MKKIVLSFIVLFCVGFSLIFSSLSVDASTLTGSTMPMSVSFPFTLQYGELYYDFTYIGDNDNDLTFSTDSFGGNVLKNWYVANSTRETDSGNCSVYYVDVLGSGAYYYGPNNNIPYDFGLETLYLRFNDFYVRTIEDIIVYFPSLAVYDDDTIINYSFDSVSFNSNTENFDTTHYSDQRTMAQDGGDPTNFQFAKLISRLGVVGLNEGYIISNLVISYDNLDNFAIEIPYDVGGSNFTDIGTNLEYLFDYDIDFGGIFNGIFNAIDGFIYAEIFPGVTIGALVLVIIAIPLLIAFLRFFAGG